MHAGETRMFATTYGFGPVHVPFQLDVEPSDS